MKPLDLTQRPPRSPRERLGDIAFLPRTIDKMRAALPGGSQGAYNDGHVGASAVMLGILGIAPDDLHAVVAAAATEDEVTAWVLERTSAEKIAEANRIILTRTIQDFPPEQRARIEAVYPAYKDRPETLVVDLLEADDRASFAS